MTAKQITGSATAPDGSQYVTLTDGAGNLVQLTGGQLPGTTTNDNAAAGNVGEYIFSSVPSSQVTLSTGVSANLTSITLTAGDWQVNANAKLNCAATTTIAIATASLSTTSATVDSTNGRITTNFLNNSVPNTVITLPIPYTRFSLASTTTIFLVGNVTFGTSTCQGGGQIAALRVR